jgi:hypothetical protein
MTPAKATGANAPHATLWEALVAFQGDVTTITKDKTAKVQTRSGGEYEYHYAGLDSVMEVVRPILERHGLAWYALPGLDEHGQNVLPYFLVHGATGESISGVMPLLVEERTGSSSTQALGSAITYARRYAMTSVLNLVTEEDDDGQAAGHAPKASTAKRRTGASEAQRNLIHDLAQKKGVGRADLSRLAGITVEEGWMDKLTPGKNGTASALIDALMNLPAPKQAEAQSDVPTAQPGEFEHPPVDEAADVPFSAEPDEADLAEEPS